LSDGEDIERYFASFALTEINMSMRLNFLKFLHGCNLHGLPTTTSSTHAAAVVGLKSVIKCMTMPYIDRAFMEFIYHTSDWKPTKDYDSDDDSDIPYDFDDDDDDDQLYYYLSGCCY